MVNPNAEVIGNGNRQQVAATTATSPSATAAAIASAPPTTQHKGYAHLFKYIVVGDSGSGKTALVRRYARDAFIEERIFTVGVDFDIKTVSLPNGDDVKLQIWDTAGQERFRTITSSYYRGATGVVIVYDITDIATFNNVKLWLQEIQRYCKDDVKTVVIANKVDLWDGLSPLYGKDYFKRSLGFEDEKDDGWLSGLSIVGWHECSAKSGQGVQQAFEDLTHQLVAERLDKRNPLRGGGKVGGSKLQKKGSDGSLSLHDNFHTDRVGGSIIRTSKASSGCCVIV